MATTAAAWNPATTCAHQMAMPLLIINMGGEMLYILEQRLQAQSIVEEKSLRVLQDVISTMFSEKFIGELFKPQRIYSNSSTRQIFDRLAHSSIMRLNESSMDKLYDLMTMGCKYQLLSCSHPSQLLQISLNHLDALRKLVKTSDVVKLVDSATTQLVAMFKDLTPGEWSLLRHTLCRFFQDRRVKVSLFLQDGIQSTDGAIIIHHKGVMAHGTEIPGAIRYFDTDGKLNREERIKLKNTDDAVIATEEFDISKPTRPCTLGTNLYAKDRRKTKPGPKAEAKAAGARPGEPKAAGASELDESSRKAAKAELNLLANLIVPSPAKAAGAPAEKFSIINLFPDTALPSDEAKAGGEKQAELITFDQEEGAEWSARLAAQVADLDIDDAASPKGSPPRRAFSQQGVSAADEDDDLLSLMDRGH